MTYFGLLALWNLPPVAHLRLQQLAVEAAVEHARWEDPTNPRQEIEETRAFAKMVSAEANLTVFEIQREQSSFSIILSTALLLALCGFGTFGFFYSRRPEYALYLVLEKHNSRASRG